MSDVAALLSTLREERAHLDRLESESWRMTPRAIDQLRRRWARRIAELEHSLRQAGWQEEAEVRLVPPVIEIDAPRAALVLREGQVDEEVVPLTGEVRLGRGRDCDIQLRDDGNASRMHCRVAPLGDDRWVVEDLGSANGTLVNGELYLNQCRPLYGGEELILGGTFLRFRRRR